MNILPFLHFFAFLVYVYLLTFLLWRNSKSNLNKVCAAFLACFALWSFMLIFLYIPGTLKNTAILFDNIASIGWIGLASFFLWFSLILTEKKRILESKIFYFIIFAIPLWLIYKKWTGFLTIDYIEQLWGWAGIWSNSIWPKIFYFYFLSFIGIGLYFIYSFGRKTSESFKKKQAQIIFLTALISLLLSTLIEVILPELKIFKIPSLANVFTLIWVGGLVYAIVKYKFMTVRPGIVAEKILSTMADCLILLDNKGKIVAFNEALHKLTGYKENEVKGKTVDLFFVGKELYYDLLNSSSKKESVLNQELYIKTKNSDNVPVLLSSSTISNESGDLSGIVCIIRDITERKRTEENLRKSQEEATSLFQNSPLAGIYHDGSGLILNVNYKFTKLFGYSPEEIIGKNINDGMIFPEEETINESNYLTQLTLEGKDIEYETIRKKKDGSLVPVIITVAPILNQQKNKTVIAFYQDRTKYKQALEKITESEKKYHTLFDNMPAAYYQSDKKGNLLMMNPTGVKLLGFSSLAEVIGRNIAKDMYYKPEDRKLFLKTLEDNKGKIRHYEVTLKRRNGQPVIVSTNSQYYYNEVGDIAGVEGIFVDITERKQDEKVREILHYIARISNSSISLSRLYEIIHQQINTLIDATNFYITLVNKEKNQVYFPYSTNQTQFEYQPRPLSQHSLNTLVLNSGKTFFINSRMIMEDIHYKKYEKWFGSFRKAWLGIPLRIEEDTIGALVVQSYANPDCFSPEDIQLLEFISSQISIAIKRKLDEETIHQSQQEFLSLFQSHSEALLYVNEEGTIIDANKRFTQLFGYTLNEIKGKNVNCGIIHPKDRIEEGEELDKKAITNGYVRFETIRKKKDGTLFPVSISGSPVIIDGKNKGIIGTFIDITERKTLEEQLSKMARIDSLTGCYNRRYGLELIDRQIKLSNRNQSPILLAFFDIDDFKNINDKYGHLEGDTVLRRITNLFKENLREVDIICRMGGDEFLLVFPDTPFQESHFIRERLQNALSQLNRELKKDYNIQFSMGFSEYSPAMPSDLDELIAIADQEMYEAKRKNKNN
jgi:diguanylate cyclase (GGDEF)-like protein/PAS domain S-box-containing protein